MKAVFIFLITCYCYNQLSAQEEIIINPKFPFEIAPPQEIPNLMPGNYLVRTDADYFNLLNPDPFHPLYASYFPLYGGTGVIIKKGASSNKYELIIESVFETKDNVIINTRLIKATHYMNTSTPLVFIRLNKTYKEILISEEIEIFATEEDPNVLNKCRPF